MFLMVARLSELKRLAVLPSDVSDAMLSSASSSVLGSSNALRGRFGVAPVRCCCSSSRDGSPPVLLEFIGSSAGLSFSLVNCMVVCLALPVGIV